ncbi:nucleotide-binding protein [Roseococcus microcysteis]|uniref:nucleotide-binding protein n=1 Tax=Roseococcus microcysteis TaxID=2771361 RepID=UPI002FC28EE1
MAGRAPQRRPRHTPGVRAMTRLTVIASGKGGVGKTCLAIGLAQALAEGGRARRWWMAISGSPMWMCSLASHPRATSAMCSPAPARPRRR